MKHAFLTMMSGLFVFLVAELQIIENEERIFHNMN